MSVVFRVKDKEGQDALQRDLEALGFEFWSNRTFYVFHKVADLSSKVNGGGPNWEGEWGPDFADYPEGGIPAEVFEMANKGRASE